MQTYIEIPIYDAAIPADEDAASGVVGTFEGSLKGEALSGTVTVGLKLTGVSGTSPTFDFTVEGVLTNLDGTTFLVPLTTFTQLTAAGSEIKVIANCPRVIQVKWVTGGTDPAATGCEIVCWRN